MGIGKRIKEARMAQNFTQEKLASLLGVTKGAIANYENETSHPKEAILYKLLDVLDVDANYLFQDVVHTKNNFKANYTEQEFLKKYRIISEKNPLGKKLVDFALNHEYTRCTSQPEEIEEESIIYNIRSMQLSDQPASAGRGTYLGPESFHTIMVQKNDLTDRALFAVPVSGNSMEPTYYDGDILLVEKTEELQEGEIGIFTLDGEGYVKKLGDGELISLNPDYAPLPMNESILLNGKVIGILEDGWIVER